MLFLAENPDDVERIIALTGAEQVALPEGFDEILSDSFLGEYLPGGGTNLVIGQYAWNLDLSEPEDRYVDLYLRSKGAVMVMEPRSIAGDTSCTVVPNHDLRMVEEGRAAENEMEPLARYKSYIGTRFPETLVVTPPDRERRLKFIEDLPPGEWKRLGMITGTFIPSKALLNSLHSLLDEPDVIGVPPLPTVASSAVKDLGRVVV